MSGHTPGPWFVVEVGLKFDNTRCFSVRIHCDSQKPSGILEVQANANLIAAAPDLLEALENCEKRLTNMVSMSDLCANELQASIDVARKAISRAKGKA